MNDLVIDEDSFVPLVEQIRRGITAQVASGDLPIGTRLATVRQLARDLGLAPGTIARAYQLLESDGILETRGRRGSFVAAPPQADASPVQSLNDLARAYLRQAQELGASVQDAVSAVQRQATNADDQRSVQPSRTKSSR
jgi:DNA-binding transcriptional regulator YhcF (GntR family)